MPASVLLLRLLVPLPALLLLPPLSLPLPLDGNLVGLLALPVWLLSC